MLYYLFLVCLACGVTVLLYRNVIWVEENNRALKEHMDVIRNYCELLKVRMQEVRCYRHDLARHIQTLEAVLETSDKSSCEKSEILRSILVDREKLCQRKGIPLMVTVGETCDFQGFSQAEMVSLCGNLLDNAIEANEKIPPEGIRGIAFSMDSSEDELYVEVRNQVKPGEIPVFQTDKENQLEHGWGLKIVKTLVENNEGREEITYDEDKDRITISVTLRRGNRNGKLQ